MWLLRAAALFYLMITPAFAVLFSGAGPSNPDYPFTALHTYYIAPAGNSPAGSDLNSGTSASTPWLTLNHSGILCGDVIIAAAPNNGGFYSSANFDSHQNASSLWGTVGSCPSPSTSGGGIDGTGGINFATLVCATAFACNVADSATGFSMYVDKSNWAIEGFQATDLYNLGGACFTAGTGLWSTASISYVAFINDIAENCPLVGFFSTNGANVSYGIDEFAVVGDIAYNAAQSATECGSGMGTLSPKNVSATTGTHIFYSQDFSFGNLNGPCGPSINSSYGGFPSVNHSGGYSSGTSLVVSSAGSWTHYPIGASGGGNTYPYASAAIPITGSTPTLISSITGSTLTLSNAITTPGLTNGQQLAVGTTTDGEGINFDTWGSFSYTGQSVVENNVLWGNGNAGWEIFCAPTCGSGLSIYVLNNTLYGNVHDYKHDGPGFGLYDNEGSGGYTLSITNNLVKEDVAIPLYSQTYSGVGVGGTGQPVFAAQLGSNSSFPGLTVSGDYFYAVPGGTCPGTCDSGVNIVEYGGTYTAGSTFSDPGFASAPSLLSIGAPNCGSYANVVACMNTGYSVAADIASSAAPTKGYQAPGPCSPDPYYPTWLKGIVFLVVSGGSTLTETHGLVTKPCGL